MHAVWGVLQDPVQVSFSDRGHLSGTRPDHYSCSIYGKYPNQCQLYPLVPKDLEEIEESCGYTFR